MNTILISFAVAAALLIVGTYAMFLDVSREEACVKAYRTGQPLSTYCSDLFE